MLFLGTGVLDHDDMSAGDALARALRQVDPRFGAVVDSDVAVTGIGGGGTVVLASLDDARALLFVVVGREGIDGHRRAAEGKRCGDCRAQC